MELFDITCTATLRPELLRRTFESHKKYLFGESIHCARLIINVDLVGVDDQDQGRKALSEIFDFIHGMNFYTVKWNIGQPGNFAKAWFWCMDQLDPKKEFFFNLEEDWELIEPIDFQKMAALMKLDPYIAHLRLSQFPSTHNRLKNWNKFLVWEGSYFRVLYEEAGSIGWCGHPSLNRIDFMKACLPYMDRSKNPEKQIKHHIPGIRDIINHHTFGSFHPQDTPPAVVDIGRDWMIRNNWKKAGNKAFFTNWERNEE